MCLTQQFQTLHTMRSYTKQCCIFQNRNTYIYIYTYIHKYLYRYRFILIYIYIYIYNDKDLILNKFHISPEQIFFKVLSNSFDIFISMIVSHEKALSHPDIWKCIGSLEMAQAQTQPDITHCDYELYGGKDYFVIHFSNGWKQWHLNCIQMQSFFSVSLSAACIWGMMWSQWTPLWWGPSGMRMTKPELFGTSLKVLTMCWSRGHFLAMQLQFCIHS